MHSELPEPRDVVGLPLRPLRTESLVEVLVQRARAALPTTACYANAHTVNLACRDERYRRVLCECDLLYADGASVVWAGRLGGACLAQRMTAVDCLPLLAHSCAAAGLSLYLLGGREGVADRAAARLLAQWPALKIAGTHTGFFDLNQSEHVVAAINAANPDLLLVGMSSPRQEYWLAEQAGELRVPVRWCVGALFDYVAGVERRAPAWLCRIGGEWLFRLLVDPLGKWRRYLIGNPLFVWHTLCWLMRRQRNDCPPNVMRMTER